MQKRIFLRANIDEASVESGHELAHLAHIDVANGKRGLAGLVLIFYQALVFEERDRYLFWLDIDNYFACHSLVGVICLDLL